MEPNGRGLGRLDLCVWAIMGWGVDVFSCDRVQCNGDLSLLDLPWFALVSLSSFLFSLSRWGGIDLGCGRHGHKWDYGV